MTGGELSGKVVQKQNKMTIQMLVLNPDRCSSDVMNKSIKPLCHTDFDYNQVTALDNLLM